VLSLAQAGSIVLARPLTLKPPAQKSGFFVLPATS
jgi:hypothetical protein